MSAREIRAFQVEISNLDALAPLREFFGEEQFRQVITGIGEKVAENIRTLRNPETGEFPLVTVFPTSGNRLRVEVDATAPTHEFLARRLPEVGIHLRPDESSRSDTGPLITLPVPKAFLSHAHENHAFAKRVAIALLARGVDVFLDEWEIGAGDSIRQTLERGLHDCTHFIALISPQSPERAWVQLEIDAAIQRRLEGKIRFIGLMYGVTAAAVSPFMKAWLLRPVSEENFHADVDRLAKDIFGITDKPPLGERPLYAQSRLPELSPVASAVARYFVENSRLGLDDDPPTTAEDVAVALAIDVDDMIDAFDELKGLGCMRVRDVWGPRPAHPAGPTARLFERYDRHWKDWDPALDAISVARHIQDGGDGVTEKIAAKFGWPPRRMNPALSYLVERDLVLASESKSDTWLTYWIQPNDETRRFLRQAS